MREFKTKLFIFLIYEFVFNTFFVLSFPIRMIRLRSRRRGPFSFFIQKSIDFRNNQIIKYGMNYTVYRGREYVLPNSETRNLRSVKLALRRIDASDAIANSRNATHRRRQSK